MHEHNFDEILDFLCSGIMSKSEKQSVRDELYDHLMCKYEINLAVGLDEEQAEKKAVEELGDASTLRFKLGQVHSYAPQLTLKKAINLLIFGYFLISFHISLFTGMKEITIFIGNVCMLVSLFCMRAANRKLKSAFYFKTSACILSWLSFAIEPMTSVPFAMTVAAGAGSLVFHFVSMVMLILGIKELVTPYLNTYSKNIPFNTSLFFNVFEGITNVVIYCLFIDSGETSAEISSFILFALLIIGIIITLIVFSRSSKALWNSDHEYKIEDSSGKKWIAALLAITIAVVPTVAVDFSLANQKAETSAYSIDDSDISEAEYNSTCEKLMAYGVPEKVVRSLPESEIKKYSDCLPITEYSQREQRFILSGNKDIGTGGFDDGVRTERYSCAFEIRDEDGNSYYRILLWFEYHGNGKCYDETFFLEYNNNSYIPLNSAGEYNGDFLLILSEENGKTLKNEPLDVYTDTNALTDSIAGIRFEGKDNLLILHAADYGLLRNGILGNSSHRILEFYHRTFPVSYPYRNAYDAYKNDYRSSDDFGLVGVQLFTEVHFPQPFEDDKYKDLVIAEEIE